MPTATAHHDETFLPDSAKVSDRQRLFLLYFVGALIDLVVLGLFDQYSEHVHVDDFSTMLLAAVVLQLLLKATIAVEHRVLARFKGKVGFWWKASKYFVAWVILFGSKFVILEALALVFADSVHFSGVWHGIVWLIIVVVTMVIAEELVARLVRKLA
jgi:membrane protease YdiL (CAAX protease family)